MKRLLVDVNVVLDVLLDRAPYAEMACALWAAVERGAGKGLLPAHGVTTTFYLVAKELGAPQARQAVRALLEVFEVAPVDDAVVRAALDLEWPDFEDAVCAAAAAAAGCDAIVTRDPAGFRGSPVRVVEAGTAVGWLRSGG